MDKLKNYYNELDLNNNIVFIKTRHFGIKKIGELLNLFKEKEGYKEIIINNCKCLIELKINNKIKRLMILWLEPEGIAGVLNTKRVKFNKNYIDEHLLFSIDEIIGIYKPLENDGNNIIYTRVLSFTNKLFDKLPSTCTTLYRIKINELKKAVLSENNFGIIKTGIRIPKYDNLGQKKLKNKETLIAISRNFNSLFNNELKNNLLSLELPNNLLNDYLLNNLSKSDLSESANKSLNKN